MRKPFESMLLAMVLVLGAAPAWADGLIDLRVDADTFLDCRWKEGQFVCDETIYTMFTLGVSSGLDDAVVSHRVIGRSGQVYQDVELFTVTTDSPGPNCPNVNYCASDGGLNGNSFQTCSDHGACGASFTCPDGTIVFKTGSCNSFNVGVILPSCHSWGCLCSMALPIDPCQGHRGGSAPVLDPWSPIEVPDNEDGASVQLAPCGANTPFDTQTGQCTGQSPCTNCDPDPTNNTDD